MKTPGSVRVLLVDDLEFMRTMLRELLEPEGFIVCGEARNGQEALVQYEHLLPDITVLDITMPEMDGLTALRKLRQNFPEACVVMCSAISEQALILKAITWGAQDYIVKPFRPARVLRALKRAVGLEVL
jgi:two-component system chemotaxis response regulator CheY